MRLTRISRVQSRKAGKGRSANSYFMILRDRGPWTRRLSCILVGKGGHQAAWASSCQSAMGVPSREYGFVLVNA